MRSRINSGEFSERSLARVLQVSQPHLHNMLKGARGITGEFADHVMLKFKISILDLITDEEILAFLGDKNEDWLTDMAKRKPAAKSSERDGDPRAPWKEQLRRSSS